MAEKPKFSVGGKATFKFGDESLGVGGYSRLNIKPYEPPDPETPTAEWTYDCPCGEQHRLATAVTSALRCGKTGAELNEQERFGTEIRPYKEAFPTDYRWATEEEGDG